MMNIITMMMLSMMKMRIKSNDDDVNDFELEVPSFAQKEIRKNSGFLGTFFISI